MDGYISGDTMPERRVLHLGCGNRPIEGAINHDRIKHSDAVDIAFDLDWFPWQIDAERFDKIIALDVFEHLHTEIAEWMRECWRILADDGELVIRVAAWNNPVSYRDPTHQRFFMEETFYYFDPCHTLYQEYGRIYFPNGPWFHVKIVERGNADPRWPDRGDICVVMTKEHRP